MPAKKPIETPPAPLRAATPERIEAWLTRAVAAAAGLEETQVERDRPMADFGLGSRELVTLGVRLSEELGWPLSPTLVYDHPTVASIARAAASVDAPDLPPPSAARGSAPHSPSATTTSGSREREAGASPVSGPPERDTGAPPETDAVAVLSMACRFPGADDPQALWRRLAAGADLVSDAPGDRWDTEALLDPDPDAPGKAYSLRGGYLNAIDGFDAEFFGIPPQEAAAMDPQQRLLLQTAWETVERAGILPASLNGSATGVYIGLYQSGYLGAAGMEQLDGYVGTGTVSSVASGRIAYHLGLQGPAITVDTACSSSLVALHLAAQALLDGTCDLALAGGATLMVSPRGHVEFSRLRGLSASGRCRPFAQDADGVVWGEGSGLVLLKRLSEARRDGDRVLAVVKGSAANQDGRSQGLSAPSGPAQERVVRAALKAAGLRPEEVDYVEAHGTGTPLGDPIEGTALARVFGPGRPADRPLAVGSLKSNIGHTQAAAGIAGVIKTVLSLQHERIPASLNAETPTGQIDWEGGGLELCTRPRPWPRGPRPRRAGVSAYGISGTNVHVVLEEAPEERLAEPASGRPDDAASGRTADAVLGRAAAPALERPAASDPERPYATAARRVAAQASGQPPAPAAEEAHGTATGRVYASARGQAPVPASGQPPAPAAGHPPAPERPVTLFPLSARTLPALYGQADRLLGALSADPALALPDVARTLAHRRTHFEQRAVLVAREREELLTGLRALAAGQASPELVVGPRQARTEGKVAFVFPGQGTQWAGMARDLLEASPLFADEIDRCDAALRPHTGWSVLAVLRGDAGAPSLDRVDVVQPALFAVMVALAAVWRSRGVRPDAVVGHSQGEAAAACVAGALSLNDAAAVIATRAQALTTISGTGGTAVVALSRADVEARLDAWGGRLSVAAVNSSTSTVVSGDAEDLEALLAELEGERIFARKVKIDYASHSAQVTPVRTSLLDDLEGIETRPTDVAWYSTVLAERVSGEPLDAAYWYRNLREPVRYAATVERMAADGYRHFVELSPHPALITATRAVAEETGHDLISVGSLKRGEDGPGCLDRAAAELHTAGGRISWPRLMPDGPWADLPTYAWSERRHWTDTAPTGPHGTPLVDVHVESSDVPDRHLFDTRIDLRDRRSSYLSDHRVAGAVWLPAAAFLEMALEAVSVLQTASDVQLHDVAFERPLQLTDDVPVQLQLVLQPADEHGARPFGIASRPVGDRRAPWVRHVGGRVVPATGEPGHEPAMTPAGLREECAREADVTDAYTALAALGIDYGPAFRMLEGGWGGPSGALGRLARTPRAGHLVHPVLIDAALHTAALAGDALKGRAFVPRRAGRLRLTGLRTAPVWSACRLRAVDDDAVTLDVRLLDENEQLLLEIEGVELAALSTLDGALFEVRWQPRPAAQGQPSQSQSAQGQSAQGQSAQGQPAQTQSAQGQPAREQSAHEQPVPGGWLILADDTGVADGLSRRLGATPHVIARKGGAYTVEAPGRYTVDPGDPQHFPRLLDEAFAEGPPTRVVHLFALDAPAVESAGTAAEAALLCSVSTLNLVRALSGRAYHPSPRLFLITRGSQAAGGSTEVTHPQQAIGWGFGTAVAQEHPELNTTLVDLPSHGGEDALWTQLRHADDEHLVALRDNGRLVPRLVHTGPDQAGTGTVRRDGTYLITGGLGGLGRVVADRLAGRGAGQLALLSRSAPDAAATRWIESLRRRGTAVRLVRADVADRDALRAALDALRAEGGPVTGVIHTAGVLDDATLHHLTPERIRRVMAPKVLGTALLTELVPEAETMVLFSSAAGLLGSAGQSPYSAANAFMDAWAHHLSLVRRPALSLDWGTWADIGMVAGSAKRTATTSGSGLVPFSPQQGGEMFDRVLSTARRQLVPLALDRDALARDPDAVRTRPLLHGLVAAPVAAVAVAGVLGEVLAARTDTERTGLLESHVRSSVAELTGRGADEVAATEGLKELGLDSLMIVRLRNTLGRDLGVELSASAVFSAADIRGLAEELHTALSARNSAAEPATGNTSGSRPTSDTGRGHPTSDTGLGRPASGTDPETDPHTHHVELRPATRDVELRPATRDVVRLLRAAQHGTPSAAHTIGLAFRLTEPTTRARLTDILTRLAGRHAALRTSIVNDTGSDRRMRTERAPARSPLRWSDLAPDAELDAGHRLSELLGAPFDVTTAPLWRFELIDGAEAGQTLLLGAHHAVSDLQSLLIVAAEIDAELSGTPLGEGVSNRDIDLLLEAQPTSPHPSRASAGAPDAAARREEFAGSRRLDLTLTHPRPAVRSFRAGSLTLAIPEGLMPRVSSRARQLGITPAAFSLGVLTVLLARKQQRDRFVLAVPVDTRIHVDAPGAVGFFGVPVPFPAQATAGERIEEVLRRTDSRLDRVLAKGAMFSDTLAVLAEQGLHRENAPMVEVYFNYIRSSAKLDALEILPVGTGHSDLDLMIIMTPDAGQLRFDHNLDIIDEAACAALAADFLQLLEEVADDPAAPVRPEHPAAGKSVTATAPLPARPRTLPVAATFALGDLPLLCAAAWAADPADGAPSTPPQVVEAPYHQVLASLKDPSGVFADPSAEIGTVLVRAVDLERFGPVSEELLDELRTAYPDALRALSERTRLPLIVGFLPSGRREARYERWERDVAAVLADLPGIAVLRPEDWTRHHVVEERFDERTDTLAHLPFTPEFQAAVALTLAETAATVRRTPPKVIAVDGDETLWSGVAGESGPQGVDLGGARALLARRLLRWRAAGTLLVLISNNDEATVRAVLERPDSVLRAEHFSVLDAGWGRKADRLEAAARTMNLGPDSFLFLDDNPAEIAAMRSALPEVLSVTCPAAGELEPFLARLWPLIPAAATAEDGLRADFYRQERARDAAREQAGFEEFLEQLELELDIRPLAEPDTQRAAQLIRRTNQFTLRERSADGGDLQRWREDGEVWTVAARDRFGDYGQIGLLALRQEASRLDVLAWLLSCRVLGRGVEERLLQWLADRAETLGRATVRLTAEPTPRNLPARRLIAALGGGAPDGPGVEAETTPRQLRAFRSWRQ
ncbi:type I polyketide synthase [Streptomyces sp. WZ.A104]|uniref:type I polyketide synthase n=1 Tax=Streptomyces sp. WZ.A104 TaxID=2023771 RepID=UPI00211C538E|nr:type I polyketide synthase [Streptomyces sp. WZ.A104]